MNVDRLEGRCGLFKGHSLLSYHHSKSLEGQQLSLSGHTPGPCLLRDETARSLHTVAGILVTPWSPAIIFTSVNVA